MIRAPIGVKLAGLRTNGQPTARAGATLCAARFKGKLNGDIKEHGPMGTRFHTETYPSVRGLRSSGIYSPVIRTDSSAAILNVSINRVTSPRLSLIGFPASMQRACASSSALSLNRVTQCSRTACRWYAGISRIGPVAFTDIRIASPIASSFAMATRVAILPENLSITSRSIFGISG